MFKVTSITQHLLSDPSLVVVPFSTHRREGAPKVPDVLADILPEANTTLAKYPPRDSYYYVAGGNTYLFQRIKSSSKASAVSIDLVNLAVDAIEELSEDYKYVFILSTEDTETDEYLKLVFKNNNSVFLYQKD